MGVVSSARKLVPQPVKKNIRNLLLRTRSTRDYEKLYEDHAQRMSPETSIGNGDYQLIGRLEKALLFREGFTPSGTLVDLGCGTGRLAIHIVPEMQGGRYIGTDISPTMLKHAQQAIAEVSPNPPCSVELRHQKDINFQMPAKSVDAICAFSVFTHMEHEDTYLYLRSARNIVKDDGMFVLSCLPMTLSAAREVFLQQASLDPVARWGAVRNVTTSKDMMEALAEMTGWRVAKWYSGDEPNMVDPATDQKMGFGQSVCVLKPN